MNGKANNDTKINPMTVTPPDLLDIYFEKLHELIKNTILAHSGTI
jgi:hypothetical protein